MNMKTIKKVDQTTIDILENFFDNIMIYNDKGVLLYACEKFWNDTGFSSEEFQGKGLEDIKELNIYKPYVAELAFKSRETITVVQQVFEDEVTVATAVPLKDAEGRVFAVVTYAENNNRIIELEGKLEQANKILEEKNAEISKLLTREITGENPLEESSEVLRVHKLINRIADFDANVLLTGETGVGKTMYAKRIHSESERQELPFIEINCAAIPETLLESELFGYEKGAFTGANEKGKKGQIELAAGGTLFLDEISELSMNLQSKLLKVIQDKKITHIGGTDPIDVNFRLIVASNKKLEVLVEEGKFRSDLYYRLNVIPIEIPALRQRREDIHPLAKFFLHKFNKKYNENKYFNRDVLSFMMEYDWPGNVRELENSLERLVLTVEDNEIKASDIPFQMKQNMIPGIDTQNGIHNVLNSLEKQILKDAYEECRGNVSKTARKLKLTRQSVLRRLEKYEIVITKD